MRQISRAANRRFRATWQVLQETFRGWQAHQISLLASSLAYYTLLSLAPLLALVMMIVGAVFGEAAARGQIVTQLQEIFGPEGAQVIETAILNFRPGAQAGRFQLLFNLGFLAFGASGFFAQIQNALDRIWEVKPEPGRQILNFIRKRLLSFLMVLVIALLVFLFIIANTALAVLVEYLNDFIPGFGYFWQILSLIISLALVTLLLAAMFTILPDAKIAWQNTLVGAGITTTLFMLGQFLFSLFLRQTDLGSAYGVAGSLVIVITWIYYTAHILFLGAEFTKVYAKRRGAPIVPAEYAIRVSQEQRSH